MLATHSSVQQVNVQSAYWQHSGMQQVNVQSAYWQHSGMQQVNVQSAYWQHSGMQQVNVQSAYWQHTVICNMLMSVISVASFEIFSFLLIRIQFLVGCDTVPKLVFSESNGSSHSLNLICC